MTARIEPNSYPTARPRGLPASPLKYISTTFGKLLNSPRCLKYLEGFERSSQLTRDRLWQPNEFNNGLSYLKAKEVLLSMLNDAISKKDFNLETWIKISKHPIGMPVCCLSDELIEKSRNIPLEFELLCQINMYIDHELAHFSPLVTIFNAIVEVIELTGTQMRPGISELPAPVADMLTQYLPFMERHFDYYEEQVAIGGAFFMPQDRLASLVELKGSELYPFMEMIARLTSLRFVGSHFKVVGADETPPADRNSIRISVDPALHDMHLPRMILGPKIAGDIKNALREVHKRETALFKHDPSDPKRGVSLLRHLRGERPIDQPVRINMEARKLSNDSWEMVLSDNGRGVIVEEMFNPLAKACTENPQMIAPALERAVRAWKGGDPFAFNNIPVGDLLEAIFHLGVSTGQGRFGSGMGLWGSMGLLLRLGAKISVGFTPDTGGFYESVSLPMNLDARASH